jgi:YHS domain-containing protein
MTSSPLSTKYRAVIFVLSLSVPPIAACTSSKPAASSSPPAQVAQSQPASDAPTEFDAPPTIGTKAKCPVSGETFTVSATTERSERGGKHFVFCCPECKPDFDKDPAKYTKR